MYDDTLKIFAGIDTDGVKSGMKDVKSLVDKGMNAVKSVTSAGASAISGVTKAVTGSIAAAGSGVLAFGGYAVNAGKTFEKSMSNVMATMGITKDTIQDGQNSYELLSETAKKMGETTKFSASESADALNFLALAGYDAQKACEALPAVLNLAQAGNMDLARTSDLVTDAMSALGIEATNENLTHFGDVLAKTSSRSNTSVAQLGEAMLVCGGQSRLAGLELEETSTMLGILADNGIKGAEGGTALRNLLKNIYTPTSQASKAMQALGIQTSDTNGNLRNVQDILIDTMSALENLSEADKMTAMGDIFDVRTIAAASATLNNCSERYNELYGEIMDCNGAMEQMAETQNDNLEGDIYSLKSAFEAVGVAVEEKLNKSLRNAVQLGTSYLRKLNDSFKKNGFDGLANSLGDELGDAVTKISAKIPDFINIGSSIVKSFMQGISDNSTVLAKSASKIVSSLATGILDLFPMFITVGGQLVSDFSDGISEKLPELSSKAFDVAEWLYNGFKANFTKIIDFGTEIITGLGDRLAENAGRISDEGAEIIDGLADSIAETLPKIIDTALELTEKFGDKISENSEKIVSAGAKIISSLIEGIKRSIPKVIKTAKQVIKDFADALEKEVPALKPFAEAVKFVADNFEMLASVAVGMWTAFKGYTIISKVSKAVSLLGDAVKIAGLAMTAHPLGLALMGIAGIATALISLDSMAGDYETNLDKAIKKEQEYIEKIDERQKNYQDLRENARNIADENFAPVDRVSELAKELDNLADASGRVRDEDVERVNAILKTMNDVLGTDYTLVDNQIQKYDELKNSIDDVIAKKHAEILLDANAEPYEEAVKSYKSVDSDRTGKLQEMNQQKSLIENLAKDVGYSLNSVNDVYRIATGDLDEVYNEYLSLVNSGKINADVYDFDAWIEQIDYIQRQADMYKTLEEAYQKLDSEADTYYKVIQNYDSALGAFESGNSEKAVEILEGRANSLKNEGNNIETSSAEYAVKMENARKTVEDAQITYDTHAEKLRNNVEGYTNTIVNSDKNALAESRIAYYEMAINAEKSGSTDFLNAMSENEKIGFENYSLIKKLEGIYEDDKAQLEKLKENYWGTEISSFMQESIKNLEDKVIQEELGLKDIYMRSGAKTSDAFGGELTSEERIERWVSAFAGNTNISLASQQESLRKAFGDVADFAVTGFTESLSSEKNIAKIEKSCEPIANVVTRKLRGDFEINSPSKLMRDEIGKWILPGIAVGVDDTVNETANNMNSSINSLISQIDSPEISPLKVNSTEFAEPNVPELSPINIESPEINIPEQSEIELNSPEFAEPDVPELSPINIKSPEINIPEKPEIKLNSPEIAETDVPDFSPLQVKSPEIIVSDSEPVELISPEVIESEIPQLSPMTIDSPEINIPEQPEIKLNSPEIDEPESGMFTQQIRLLREFLPENNIPQIADERITEEIQSQIDAISVNLNADSFISKFQNVLSNIGINAVPQYSTVYNQIQTAPQNHEINKLELPQNTGQNAPEISIFIGDEEIKNFVVSTLNEANAVSGGASF